MVKYLTTKDIMEMFQVTRMTVNNWRKEKGLPYSNIGSLVRFEEEEVKYWYDNQTKIEGGEEMNLIINKKRESKIMNKENFEEEFGLADDDLKYFNIGCKNITLLQFYELALIISNKLGNSRMFDEYKSFIDKYNEILPIYFEKDLENMNHVFNFAAHKDFLIHAIKKDMFFLKDSTDIFKKGEFKNEKDLEKSLVENFKIWSDEWLIGRQKVISGNVSDITIEWPTKKEKTAIELKKSKAYRKCVYQAYDYSMNNEGFKPILIAKKFDSDVLELAERLGVSCYEYNLYKQEDSEIYDLMILKNMTPNVVTNETENYFEEMNCQAIFEPTFDFLNRDEYTKVINKARDFYLGTIKWYLKETENGDLS